MVALLFAMRLTAAALGHDFSPFPYVTPSSDHTVQALFLLAAMAVVALLVWLVLRHDADYLWLVSGAGVGGVLVASSEIERPAVVVRDSLPPGRPARRGRALPARR